jgi:hypothetical protein
MAIDIDVWQYFILLCDLVVDKHSGFMCDEAFVLYLTVDSDVCSVTHLFVQGGVLQDRFYNL